MALNYAPLSQCVSLFVANQFRVSVRQTANPVHRCYSKYELPWVPARTLQFRSRGNKRILYQQTSFCCWRDIQNFSSTPTIYNPHTSFVRAKYSGDKTGSGSELLPFMSKTGKNKKLTRVKSCLECGKKVPSKDKLKIFRPTDASSSATTPSADFKSHILLKPYNGKQLDVTQKQNEAVAVSQVAKEMVDYFNKFIDQLNKMDKTLRLQKIRESSGINKYTDRSVSLILPVREATNPQTSSSVSAEGKVRVGKKTPSQKKKKKISNVGTVLENSKLNQVERETCTVKGYTEETELLEIRPKYVENVQQNKDVMNFKKTTTAAKNASKKEMNTYVDNNGFILVESASPKYIENKVQAKNQGGIPSNENGFILVYPEDSKADQSTVYCSQPEEKGFILVNDKEQSKNSQRRSKEDNRNFVVINDNPFCNLRSTRTGVDDSQTSQVSNVKDVLPRPDINVQIHMVDRAALGPMSLDTQDKKNTDNRMSGLFDNQSIGSSDSKEELQRQRKNVGDVQPSLSVTSDRSKPEIVVNFQPVNLEPTNGMVGSKFEDVELQTSRYEDKKISEGEMATWKNADDSANRNSINLADSTINGGVTMKEGGVQTEENTTKKDDTTTAKKSDDKKANKEFQGGTIGSKSSHDLHVGDFGNAMKEYLKLNLEPRLGKRKSGKKGVKHASSLINVTTQDSTKSSAIETSPLSVEVSKTTKPDCREELQISTSATNLHMTGVNSYGFRHQRSPAVAVHELKPDSPQKQVDRRSTRIHTVVTRHRNEPQLVVKPEEMCSKIKMASRPGTGVVYSAEQHMLPQMTSPTYSSVAQSPSEKGLSSCPKSPLDAKQDPEQLYKIHSQEMNTCQKSILSGQEKNQVAPIQSLNDTMGFSSARSEASSAQVKKGMTLSEVFRQLQHTKDTKMPRSSSTTTCNLNAVVAKARSSRKEDELIRIIRQQWSRDFQEKFHNLQPITLYSPYSGNCSTEATQNSNTSAGSMQEKEKKTSRHVERKSKHKSPPAPTMVHVSRKSDHLPTMGMAERLLAASQRPSGSNDPSPKVKDSESSMNTYTDATVTQGTAEVEDFPEVDQFEEFVQSKMPEIFRNNRAKTTQTGDTEVGLPINNSTNDSLRLSNDESLNTLHVHEGSNVDGDFYSQTASHQPRTNNNAGPVIENEQLNNSITVNTIRNDRHPDKQTSEPSRGTNPKAQYNDKSASMRNTSLSAGPTANVASPSQDPYSSHDNLTNTNTFPGQVGSPINISHQDAILPTSTPTSTRRSSTKGKPLSKSAMLKSLDGFACLTLVEEPQKVSSKNLKPSLKRSPSRERGEEKRVSFVKTSKDDNSKVKYPEMESFRQQIDRYAGSSVDRPQVDDNFSGGNNSKECDLRAELAEQRKRAEMEARIKLLNEHSKQIREYEAVLSKYRDIVSKFKDDALKAIRGKDSQKQKSSEV